MESHNPIQSLKFQLQIKPYILDSQGKIIQRVNLIILLGLLLTLFMGCSNDDDFNDEISKNIEAKVSNFASCNTADGGRAYELDVDGFDFAIITGTLPVEFQEIGLDIIVDMERSTENLTICTDNLSPDQFYKVTNVSRKEE